MGTPSANQVLEILTSTFGSGPAQCVWDQVNTVTLVPALIAAVPTGGASLVGYLGPIVTSCGVGSVEELAMAIANAFVTGGGSGEKAETGGAKECYWTKPGKDGLDEYWDPVCIQLTKAGWRQKSIGGWGSKTVVDYVTPAGWQVQFLWDMKLGSKGNGQTGVFYVNNPDLVVTAGAAGLPTQSNPGTARFEKGGVAKAIEVFGSAPTPEAVLAKYSNKKLPPGVRKIWPTGACLNTANQRVDCQTGAILSPTVLIPPTKTDGDDHDDEGGIQAWHIGAVVAVLAILAALAWWLWGDA
ncbi:MAG: hypothetical protein H6747_08940 [Deltaproteobacteria bacterium]|nr:hypothetical protein [Deltaproteobacteria bacterium]